MSTPSIFGIATLIVTANRFGRHLRSPAIAPVRAETDPTTDTPAADQVALP